MIFSEIINRFIDRFPDKLSRTSEDSRKIAKFYINLSAQRVYDAANWYFRKRVGNLVLIPNYTTGTCAITKYDGTNEQAARTVTFSGATITSNFVGRYFSQSGGENWYKIVYISGSTVYLDSPIIESSASSASFIIWKRFYYVKSEAAAITDFLNYDRNSILDYKHSNSFTAETGNIDTTGSITTFVPYGSDPFDDTTYTTGSVSGTDDSNILTGAGTEWLANSDSGDIVTINSIEYTVKRVETNTRIILEQYLDSEVAAGTSYSIRRKNPIGFQFYYNADDYKVLNYEYMRRFPFMINEDKDFFQMPDEFLVPVLDRAEAMLLKDKKDSGWVNVMNLYEAEVTSLKTKKNVVEPRFLQFAPANLDIYPGRE